MPTVQALYDRYKHDPEVVFLIVSRLDTPQRAEYEVNSHILPAKAAERYGRVPHVQVRRKTY